MMGSARRVETIGARIGEARGFDGEAIEAGDHAALALRMQLADGVGEIAADGAADATALQDHGFPIDDVQEKVIEADLAELVDQDGRIRELG